MENNNHYLYINWEDDQKNMYRVGILAKIDDVYYLRTYTRKPDDERDAYSHGYIGIPGFIPGELYKSTHQLFDFFKNRVYVESNAEKDTDYFEELKKSQGKTLTDSFSIEEMPENYRAKCKSVILAMDKQKQRLQNKKIHMDKCI